MIEQIEVTEEKKKEQLIELFKTGNCFPFVDYLNKEAETLSYFEINFVLSGKIEVAFNLAIKHHAHEFIADMLNYPLIMNALDNGLLIEYMESRDQKFKHDALFAMATHSNRISFSLSWYIRQWTEELMNNSVSMEKTGKHTSHEGDIEFILKNTDLKFEDRREFLRELIYAYNTVSEKSNDEEQILKVFFQFLPEDDEGILFILEQTTFQASNKLLESILERKNIKQSLLISLLENEYLYFGMQRLRIILNKIIFEDKYSIYQTVLDFLNLDKDNFVDFIIKNPAIITDPSLTFSIRRCLINSLSKDDKKVLITRSIEDPLFDLGSLFLSQIHTLESDTIIRYLRTSHVITPQKLLSNIIDLNIKELHLTEIIKLLLARSDYLVMKEEIFVPLLVLFTRGFQTTIEVMLNTDTIFDLLKNYYQLRGDECFSVENHDKLIPLVLSWYLTYSDKAEELFFALPKKEIKTVIKGCVPGFIDQEQPTLHACILRKGTQRMAAQLGGYNPRLVEFSAEKPPAVYMPTIWKNPKVTSVLQTFQKKYAVKYSKEHSGKRKFIGSNDEIEKIAQDIVEKCFINKLYLQHETANAENVLVDGYLKSRLHIQGHSLFGKASNGLLISSTLDHMENDFSYFTHITDLEDSKRYTDFSSQSPAKNRFVINLCQLLAENPHIDFMIIGLSSFFKRKKLLLPSGLTIDSNTFHHQEGYKMIKVTFSSENRMLTLYKKLFELMLSELKEAQREEVARILSNPKTEEDQELARNLIGLLPVEWLIPGDVSLKLSYVERVELEDSTYKLAPLLQIVTYYEERDIIDAIDQFVDIVKLPFVLSGILAIAVKRNHREVVAKIMQFQSQPKASVIIHQPNSVYTIESLVQLILEDLSNERVYVHYSNDALMIKSSLLTNTNRSGAHHAEMVKLHYALGEDKYQNKNALQILLDDQLSIKIGEEEKFSSLEQIQDALLTYELTTVLASQQNLDYFTTHGEFHPQTGKGATNGQVSLKSERLYHEAEAYRIQVHYDSVENELQIVTSSEESVPRIIDALNKTLATPVESFRIESSIITLTIPVTKLIAKLRQTATFYEGINVITDDGRLLVAKRRGKGLASAGGHHGDKYAKKGIAYGLCSEFGLVFTNPKEILKQVALLDDVKTISKTGIYVVRYSSLMPNEKAKEHALKYNLPIVFYADPDEFEPGSEQALTLVEMRGKAFYDVMPLAELCQYQLKVLKKCLAESCPELSAAMTVTINDSIELVNKDATCCKVPGEQFGCINVSIDPLVAEHYPQIIKELSLLAKEINGSEQIYLIDESPLVLLEKVKEVTNLTHGKLDFTG